MCPCAALIASFSSSFSFFSFHFFLHIFLFSTPPTLVILFLAPCHSPTRIGVLLVCFFSLCKSLLTLLPLTISSCLSASVLVSCLTFLLQFSCCSCSHTHTHTHAHTHTHPQDTNTHIYTLSYLHTYSCSHKYKTTRSHTQNQNYKCTLLHRHNHMDSLTQAYIP